MHFKRLRVAVLEVRPKSLRAQHRTSEDYPLFTINYPFIRLIGADILAEIDSGGW